jgi:hypothetical protein
LATGGWKDLSTLLPFFRWNPGITNVSNYIWKFVQFITYATIIANITVVTNSCYQCPCHYIIIIQCPCQCPCRYSICSSQRGRLRRNPKR